MKRLLAAFATALVIALPPPAALASPIIINPSFELGPARLSQDQEIFTGSSELVGWTVFGSVSIDYLNEPWHVSDGIPAIDLDGRNSYQSGVSQSFKTEVGKVYQVQFDLSGNPGDGSPGSGGPPLKEVRVAVGNFTQDCVFEVLIGQSISTISWKPITFTFRATATDSTLSFTSLTPVANSYGALIDKVCVTDPGTPCPSTSPVPEPASLPLFGTGLVGLRAWRKRRE